MPTWRTCLLYVALIPVLSCGDDDAGGCVTNTDCVLAGTTCVNGRCSDASDASVDASMSDAALPDAPQSDARLDDAAMLDAPAEDVMTDAGPAPDDAEARFPWNGFYTGSARAADPSLAVHPLRPEFVWEETPGADRYQIQLTRDCPVTGFRSCEFEDPELDEMSVGTRFRPAASLPVSSVTPVGSRYFWRVRACSEAACSGWTDVRYLNVGRLDHDYDGDGYGDLIVGANGQDIAVQNSGAVYLYRGSPAGPSGPTLYASPNDQDARFGFALGKAGDVNADGYADFIVGAWQYETEGNADVGEAYVYFGGPGGPSTTPSVRFASPTGQANAFFGHSVDSAGDLDGDGYDDVIVGAYTQDGAAVDQGGAYIYVGSAVGPFNTPTTTLTSPSAQSGHYGVAAEGVGDLDGDGFADLAVGAFRYAPAQAGAAFLYAGNAARNWVTPTREFLHPAAGVNGQFGDSVGGGDMNGDGFSDLIIGAPSVTTPGDIYRYAGGRSGPLTPVPYTPSEPVSDAGRLGWRVQGNVDIDGDGLNDLLTGVPFWDVGATDSAGGALVAFGQADLSGTRDVRIPNPAPEARALFGYAVGAGDLTGDGRPEIIISAHRQDRTTGDAGVVYVWTNVPSAPITSWPLTILDNPLHQAAGSFGNAVGF